MRITLSIIAALSTLTVASASYATARMEIVAAPTALHLTGALKQKPAQSMPKLKAGGGNSASTYPSGCVYGNDNITRCTQICIASASGPMCADDNACYNNNGQQISCN